MCPDFLGEAGRILEGRVGALGITAEDVRDPSHHRGRRHHKVHLRKPSYGIVRVGAHLLDPATAQAGPQESSARLGERVTGPARAPVLPAIDRIGPPLNRGWWPN